MEKSINELRKVLQEYKQLGIQEQIDHKKFYLYSIITHSTAIEGSTVTEIENQLLFDEGITAKGKPMVEQLMNLDLKQAYEQSMVWASEHRPFSVQMLKDLSAIVMRNTGSNYSTLMGEFDSSKEDKAEYIQALNDSREEESMVPFQLFMLKEHTKNLRNEITEHEKSQNEDFAYLRTEVVQKGGPESKKVVQKSGPETRASILQLIKEQENITSREMANKLGINRSAILKHLKKMQEENLIRREGSQKSGKWVIIK